MCVISRCVCETTARSGNNTTDLVLLFNEEIMWFGGALIVRWIDICAILSL